MLVDRHGLPFFVSREEELLADKDDLRVRIFGAKHFYGSGLMFNIDENVDEGASIHVELDQEKDKVFMTLVAIDDEGYVIKNWILLITNS